MSCFTMIAADADLSAPAKRRTGWGKQARGVPAVTDRQARLTLLAFKAFNDRTEALSFLNVEDVGLGGRPLDIAGSSDAGLAQATMLLETVAVTSAR